MTDYTTAATRYDASRRRNKDFRLPAGYSVPQPTSLWPAENVALLECYRTWLLDGGASPATTDIVYVVMAGNVLGLALKPYPHLDDADYANALAYVAAKEMSSHWTKLCRLAVEKFRLFLRQQQGAADAPLSLPDLTRYHQGLPPWLVKEIERYAQVQQRNWRPARLGDALRRFWMGHTRLWRWLFEHYPITGINDINRGYILDYVDYRLTGGYAVSGIKADLANFRSLLRFLQEQGYAVPQALFRLPALKAPNLLPRFIPDEGMRRVRGEMEAAVMRADAPHRKRDALLDRACFYLLWQGGLRKGEVEELRLADLDLPGRTLMVRRGKGLHDRTVYLTESTALALADYLPVRGEGEHLFLYRNRPLSKDLIHGRLKATGERVGVHLSAHRLRHTCATQLLNAGCRITSIQRILGHRRLNTTMIYARVYDRTVAHDYFTAMQSVEQALELTSPNQPEPTTALGVAQATYIEEKVFIAADQRLCLLALSTRLTEPDLSLEERLWLAHQFTHLLGGEPTTALTIYPPSPDDGQTVIKSGYLGGG